MKNPPLILWTILFISQFFYAAVLESVVKTPEPDPQTLSILESPVIIALAVMATGTLAIAWMIPKLLWKQASKKLPPAEKLAESDLLEGFFTGFVVRLALLESVCLYGFVAGFLQKQPSLILPFLGASVAGFVVNFPNRTFIRKTLGKDLQGF
jgi:uncharacterized membrane protein